MSSIGALDVFPCPEDGCGRVLPSAEQLDDHVKRHLVAGVPRSQRPEVKAKQREYRQRPEVKAKQRAYMNARNAELRRLAKLALEAGLG